MRKRHQVLHLTLRNAAIHSRIFFKEARTLSQAGYSTVVVGLSQHGPKPFGYKGLAIVPLSYRLPFFLRWWRALGLCYYLHPHVLHVHAPELLPLALLVKLLLRTKVVYDMHEDYWHNRIYASEYPGRLQPFVGGTIRILEWIATRWIDHIVYAEAIYATEVGLLKKRSTVLENKALIFKPGALGRAEPPERFRGIPRMLYTGTIARTWGIFETLSIWEKVNERCPLALVIYGHAPSEELLNDVKSRILGSKLGHLVELEGGTRYLNPEIIWLMQQSCDFGIAPYRTDGHIRNRHPTRYFEFVAAGKPVFYNQYSETWRNLLSPVYPPLFAIDPSDAEASAQTIVHYLNERSYGKAFSIPPEKKAPYTWEATEAPKLLALYAKLLG